MNSRSRKHLQRRRAAACSLFLAVSAASLLAEPALPQIERLKSSPVLQHLKPNPVAAATAGPAATVAQMHVPEGFRVDLVVGEPDLHQPIAFAFDERGRIWVAEAYSYPQKRAAGQGADKIVIFEDRDGDGTFKSRKVFAEGLNLVSGFELGYGGVWVGAAPELLFIPDRNHDDVPDGPPQVLLDGFGFQDTHECLNSFMWGPDGWLYGNQGVFNLAHIGKPGAAEAERTELRAGVWRYHPTRHQFEVFANGGSNPWGLDYDEHGQIFMTHCRSYWGKGCTTHVIQGGHFWNQANANYAPFIVAEPPQDFPGYRNFMLASARYDHGAGGAGKPGSDAIFGGHSHVGTMIYYGDNWPDQYRGNLFTHNLGGHQMNQQKNNRLGSGFDTVHAGKDQLFCTDPKYVAVDLQYGPDGAVYMIDWYDQQHCHNPNTERWDRSNGRIYRMEYTATYQPRKVDLGAQDDLQLVGLLNHKNAWHQRTALRLLAERSKARAIQPAARQKVAQLLADADPLLRLRALWATALISDGVSHAPEAGAAALRDQDEFVRAWGVQLLAEQGKLPGALAEELVRMAKADSSPLVRLYLASAAQRAPEATAWPVLEALAARAEDRSDRNLPFLIWDGLAQRMPGNLERALTLAAQTRMPQLADWIRWYAAALPGEGLDRTVSMLAKLSGEEQRRLLSGIELAMNGRPDAPKPASWKTVSPALYASTDPRTQRQAERLAAKFGDDSMFPKLRKELANEAAEMGLRKHAFAVLGKAQDEASVPTFIQLLGNAAFGVDLINVLARFDRPEVAAALVGRFKDFNLAERSAALGTLTSRASFAKALLDAVAAGTIKRDQVTAFHIRQLVQLKNAEVDQRVAANWGRILKSPAEKEEQINRLEKVFNEAPLWAYEGSAGREHFQKLCAQCHRIGKDGAQLGPELTGAGKHGIRYFLENVIDPNAVIGADFQLTNIETKKGESISGLIAAETAGAVTLRTTAGEVVVAKSDIAERSTSEKSLMPEGLLESLGDREQIELLKFLTSN